VVFTVAPRTPAADAMMFNAGRQSVSQRADRSPDPIDRRVASAPPQETRLQPKPMAGALACAA
jgi:hypothetical protein